MLALFNLFVNHFFKNKNSGLLTAIMGAALSDLDLSVDDSIDKAITLVDSAAPPAAPVAFQGLGLSDSMKRVALRVPDQLVDSLQYFNILGLP